MSTLAQIEAPKDTRAGVASAGDRGVPGDGSPQVLVSAQFIFFVAVELFLVAFRAGFVP
jgi:hypothetical protein